MGKQPSRRDFLKSGLAASALLMVGTKSTMAGQGPQLWEKSSIGSLELPNRFIKSSTWTGTGDAKGYVTDLTLKFHEEVARGGVGLILTGNQIVMTNGMSLPYSIGNYEDKPGRGFNKAFGLHSQTRMQSRSPVIPFTRPKQSQALLRGRRRIMGSVRSSLCA